MLEYLSFALIIQVFVNGILFGTMYGTAAIGLSLIFGTMRIIFIAQGTIIILLAYICYWLFTLFGIDPYLSLILLIPISLLLGAGLYHTLFRKAAALEDKSISLLIAIGLLFYGGKPYDNGLEGRSPIIMTTYSSFVFRPFGMNVSLTRLIALIMAVLATAGVALFLKKTLIGMAVRAASEDMESATLMGINPHWVNILALLLALGLPG